MSNLKNTQSSIILKLIGSLVQGDKFQEVWSNLEKLKLVPDRIIYCNKLKVVLNDSDYLEMLNNFNRSFNKINTLPSQLYIKQLTTSGVILQFTKKTQQEINNENHLLNVKYGTFEEKKRKRQRQNNSKELMNELDE